MTGDRDPSTASLALEFMAEAVRGEQELERLLGEPAPEMTGLPKDSRPKGQRRRSAPAGCE